ncbi:efflux RND transporter periplasmic adaptor subunit [Thermomonas sp.]|uniref:efflux RND transporter periplasmic adaptor subunit n=1 Tax=Thermomonas sp. TaxID=1971895 RepID=UPI00248A82A8|nr:efflux RND transporter periplasmic adaptor subunit [Thermomonas sp.]MDI1253072.1 efflux RND transporter periplasmic adaptor subunit [Thermomonas sp.]
MVILKHFPRRAIWIALAVVALALLAFGLLRHWQGPQLAAYEVATRQLVQTVVATGRVVSVSRAQVGSQISGVVVERRVREGDLVQAGDILAVLRADDQQAAVREAEAALAQLRQGSRPQAQAVLRDAQARLLQASRETQRRRTLLKQQLIARETLEQSVEAETAARASVEQAQAVAGMLEAGAPGETVASERLAAARAALGKTFIRAQVAGTVLTRNAEPGDVVQPGKVLFEIARQGDTEVLVPLDEKNLGAIALGQPAQCIADAFPDRPFKAIVAFIAPSVDPQRGTVEMRLKVSPVPGDLRQDMTVSVNVQTGRREAALVVPNDALAAVAGGKAMAWVVRGGKVIRTQVTLGLRGLTASEVVSGLKAGDLVLADGAADLADGQRVRVDRQKVPMADTGDASRNELPVRFN